MNYIFFKTNKGFLCSTAMLKNDPTHVSSAVNIMTQETDLYYCVTSQRVCR